MIVKGKGEERVHIHEKKEKDNDIEHWGKRVGLKEVTILEKEKANRE